jgi:putative membrane protein
VRTARDILDERYARGEIDREEYQRRRDDIAGRT